MHRGRNRGRKICLSVYFLWGDLSMEPLKIIENHGKSLQTIEKHWQSLKILDNHWKSMKSIEESLKIIRNHWKILKIIENHWNSLKIIANHWKALKIIDFQWFFNDFQQFFNGFQWFSMVPNDRSPYRKYTDKHIFLPRFLPRCMRSRVNVAFQFAIFI